MPLTNEPSQAFFEMHRTEVLAKYSNLVVGRLDTVAEAKAGRYLKEKAPGSISKVPFAETFFWQGWRSPYHTDKHTKYRTAVRTFYDTHIAPEAAKMDAAGKSPTLETYLKMGAAGVLAARLAPPTPRVAALYQRAGVPCPGGLPWSEFDCFCEQITHEEHARVGTPAYCDGLGIGFEISVPAVLNYGSQELLERVMPGVLRGEKRMCLAITEPSHGSDVAGLRLTARKSACGKFYLLSGVKKWITGGLTSDYFVTAVRTGKDNSAKSLSMMVVRGVLACMHACMGVGGAGRE
jgi:alkylation response protein AidB-like acyl-CoA dehydrogenase